MYLRIPVLLLLLAPGAAAPVAAQEPSRKATASAERLVIHPEPIDLLELTRVADEAAAAVERLDLSLWTDDIADAVERLDGSLWTDDIAAAMEHLDPGFAREDIAAAMERLDPRFAREEIADAVERLDLSSVGDQAAATAEDALRTVSELEELQLDVIAGAAFPRDTADSLYRAAREMLNRGEYRRAAETFRLIPQKYPTSRYAPDALYWEAFALYRIGTVADMRAALAALERQREQFPRAAGRGDPSALATRIRGELAANGDSRAAARVTADATRRGDQCDTGEMSVRMEALNALHKISSDVMMPALRSVLSRRDDCSAGLRKRAVFLLGEHPGQESAALLVEAARNDPHRDVRREAIGWLARVPTDAAVAALQEVLQRSTDDRLTSAALRALISNQNPRGRQAVRSLIERSDATESLRADAISSFTKERATPEDAAYLRSAYPRLESRRLKERVILAVSRLPGEENDRWLAGLARSTQEPVSLRAAALSRLASSGSVGDLTRLYEELPERQLREQVISHLASRKEPEAVDKLLAIARADGDPALRKAAIARLARKKDPRTTQLLLEIINQ